MKGLATLVGCRYNSNYMDALLPIVSGAAVIRQVQPVSCVVADKGLSLGTEYAPHICKTCYRRLSTIAKQEGDMQKKRQLLSQAKEVGSFLLTIIIIIIIRTYIHT